MVRIALGAADPSTCAAGIPSGSTAVTIDLILMAVNHALNGCSGANGVTATPTLTPSPTSTTGHQPTAIPAGPGLSSSIANVAIASSGSITVTFTLTDASGIPLSPVLSAVQNGNQSRVRFTVAHIENYTGGGEVGSPFTRYVNDLNATRPVFDSKGTLQTLDPVNGVYSYTFGAKLSQGFDPTHTYTVGLQVDRTFQGQQLGVDPVFDVVPAGGTPETFQGVTTQECNSCHDPLIAHGNRREVRLCMLCHTEAAVDGLPPPGTPRSIDFRTMIHKVHAGKNLPSIVNGPPGTTYAIYSTFSKADTIFAEKDANGVITGVGFPRSLASCTICHTNGPTARYYTDRPATAACAACHDDVNPSLDDTPAGPPGTNHFFNIGYGEGDCSFCHVPDSGNEFDISVKGAHVVPERSRQLAGLSMQITGVTNSRAGQIPTISFKITDTAGTIVTDLSGLDRVAFAIAGPTTDYATVLTPTAVGGGQSGTVTGPDDAGVFQYTPATGIPANAIGTWAVGTEARRVVQLTTVDPIPAKTVEEAAVNQVITFGVDGSMPLARRTVVDPNNCGSCHGQFSKDFSIHGNLRNQTEYCVLCHNPNNSDVARRKSDPAAVAAGSPVTSIDFKVMIHKIHRGENLEQKPYLIYGFGAPPTNYSINDFSDVRFPGDLRDCTKCHDQGTYLLPPFPGTALGTQVAHLDPASGNLVVTGQLGPIRAVCTACHDANDAVAHAETMTAFDGTEACTVCHEEGRDFAVSGLHAGRN